MEMADARSLATTLKKERRKLEKLKQNEARARQIAADALRDAEQFAQEAEELAKRLAEMEEQLQKEQEKQADQKKGSQQSGDEKEETVEESPKKNSVDEPEQSSQNGSPPGGKAFSADAARGVAGPFARAGKTILQNIPSEPREILNIAGLGVASVDAALRLNRPLPYR